jgi:gentisate 1,2-dioxygenase
MNAPAFAVAAKAQNVYESRARYFTNENGFVEFSWPAVPTRQFLKERDFAFDPAGPTAMIALDTSDALHTAYTATTPTLLCRYLRVRAGDTLHTTFVASGEICYVLRGAGTSRNGKDSIDWEAGDVFCFPGGSETSHRAGSKDCVLFAVTNEPLLAYERLRAPAPGMAAFEATHWPAAEIEQQLAGIYQRPITADTTGTSVQLSTAALVPSNSTIPTINTAINTLAPGGDQKPHRHNGVAVTLAIQGEGIHSIIGGERVDWSTGAAQITPATLLHSHHNRGTQRMRSFVIQDEGLHQYTRTPGFSFD